MDPGARRQRTELVQVAWQRMESNGRVTLIRDAKYGAEMLHVEWTDAEKNPFIEVTSRIATRDRAMDFAKLGRPGPTFGGRT